METSLVGAATEDHVDVQGLCKTGPTPYCTWHSGELVPSLTSDRTRRVDLESDPVVLVLVVGVRRGGHRGLRVGVS